MAQDSAPSPASAYGAEWLLSGASVDALIADMHALRASILTLWREQDEVPDLDEVLGLNHAIDQAETEAVARFSAMMQHAQHLFLAILGHDLRNPLNTTVMGASFLMRAGHRPGTRRRGGPDPPQRHPHGAPGGRLARLHPHQSGFAPAADAHQMQYGQHLPFHDGRIAPVQSGAGIPARA
ncbi:hypothetical protein LP420_36815 [Massilia sp. B-10]|nr:hypothetical protein LP420_36815 [Massilia sp. B-10]